MIRYDETKTYIHHVEALYAEANALDVELTQLLDIKPGTRSYAQKIRIPQVRARAKTVDARLKKLADFSDFSTYEELEILAESVETLWSPEEKATWNRELALHEGRGEMALRMRYGLPLVTTLADTDLGPFGEVKNLQAANKQVQPIMVGKSGKQTYCMFIMTNAEAGMFKGMSEEVRACLASGEITGGKLYNPTSIIPPQLQKLMQKEFAPSRILGGYGDVHGALEFGFIKVPAADNDIAWKLDCISKMSPKYKLQRSYVEMRLNRTLTVDDKSNVATQQTLNFRPPG